MKRVFLALTVLLLVPVTLAQQEEPEPLPIQLTEEESQRLHEIGIRHRSTAPPIGVVRNPAEWEPSEGVIIRWPLGISVEIVAEMSEDVVVTTIVGSQSQRNSAISAYSAGGVDMDNVEFIIAGTNSYWTRDYGPWFIFEDDSLAIVDHVYNRPRPLDDVIPQVIGSEWGLEVYGMDLNHAGGNHMSDGLGMSASTELVYHENSTETPAQIHDRMREYLGNEYTVLDYIESGGIHHIDCWAKYLDPTTVLVKEVAAGHPSHDRLNARAEYLAQQISPWGKPYTVVRVYCPSGTAYTNSLILNDKVLVPTFNSPWDDAALAAYRSAMPGYEVLGFTGAWLDDDALHCRAMGVPDRGMLFIDHVPFKTEEIGTGDYPIEATIVAHSAAPLAYDELRVYFSTNGLSWDHVVMEPTGEPDTFTGDVPAQQEDATVRYYVEAADESGRRETHPYVGRAGAHEFVSICPSHPLVDVAPDGPLVACEGGNLTLTTQLTGGLGPFDYQWTVDDVEIPGATGSALNVNDSGTRIYNCNVWGDGCVNPRSDADPVEVTWQAEPVFDGVDFVTHLQDATCTLELAWNAAVPTCAGPVYYDVYRSPWLGFVPDESTLLVSGVGANGYTDTHELVPGIRYHYIVRARDDSNGAHDDNLVVRSGVPNICATGSGCTMTVNVTPNGTTEACAGRTILLTATPSGGTPPYTYQWLEDGAPIPGATESTLVIAHPADEAHDYNCIVADEGSCTDVVDGYGVSGQWVSCNAAVTVADGTEGGTTPVTVSKSGADLTVHWDATTAGCASTDYHLIWGWGSEVASATVAGSDCSLEPSGSHLWATAPDTAADWSWFLVVGHDGAGTEGGWGYDSSGDPRSGTASGHCGTTTLDPSACMP